MVILKMLNENKVRPNLNHTSFFLYFATFYYRDVIVLKPRSVCQVSDSSATDSTRL